MEPIERTPSRQGDRRWPGVPRRGWSPDDADLVVVCPHPDDESLGCGGLIARQRRAGRRVVVIAVTDGEAAYPELVPAELAAVRRLEHREALTALGVDEPDTVRLGLPDGRLGEHEAAIGAATRAALARLSSTAIVVAPWPHDGHPDHEACGRAASAAAGEHELLFFVVWGWSADDGAAMLARPAELRELRLDDRAVDARRRALAAHRSQLQPDVGLPIVPPEMVDQLLCATELYVASGAASTAPIGSTSRKP